MIFVVYASEGVIQFVCHELEALLKHIRENSYDKIEIWNRNGHRAGYWG